MFSTGLVVGAIFILWVELVAWAIWERSRERGGEMSETRYFMAIENKLGEAYDRALFLRGDVAERLCKNLIGSTGEPWKVWECIVALPGEAKLRPAAMRI